MSTVAKLLAQKEQLLEQLASDPGPNERKPTPRHRERQRDNLQLAFGVGEIVGFAM